MLLAALTKLLNVATSFLVWIFVLFAGVTLTLLYLAGAAVAVGQTSENACYPMPEMEKEAGTRLEYGQASLSFLPLGVRCTFSGQNGTVEITTLEPGGPVIGWALNVLFLLGLAALLLIAFLIFRRTRDRGLGPYASLILGALAFFTPPLGTLAAAAVRRGYSETASERRLPGLLATAGKSSVWCCGVLATLVLYGIFLVASDSERINTVCRVPTAAANEQWPVGSVPPEGTSGSLTLETKDSPLPLVQRCIFTDSNSGEVIGVNRTGLGLLVIPGYFGVVIIGSTALVGARAGRSSLFYAILTLLALPLGVLLAAGRPPDRIED